MLVAMDEFVGEDAGEFLAGIGVGGGGADVGEREVDFLVVVVEVGAVGVGDAAEVAQDDGDGAGWGDGGGEGWDGFVVVAAVVVIVIVIPAAVFGRRVEMVDDIGQGSLEDGGDVRDQTEEGSGGGMAQVLDVQAEGGRGYYSRCAFVCLRCVCFRCSGRDWQWRGSGSSCSSHGVWYVMPVSYADTQTTSDAG